MIQPKNMSGLEMLGRKSDPAMAGPAGPLTTALLVYDYVSFCVMLLYIFSDVLTVKCYGNTDEKK